MNRSVTRLSRRALRTTQVPAMGAGTSALIHSSYPSVHPCSWVMSVAMSSTAKAAFAGTTNAYAAAGTATGAANTKRSPQRLGESLT